MIGIGIVGIGFMGMIQIRNSPATQKMQKTRGI